MKKEEEINEEEEEEEENEPNESEREELENNLRELLKETGEINKLGGYEFYKSIGSPKHVIAPMVAQSELPFRMLCRKYGATLGYTPMLHAKIFARNEVYRRKHFVTCEGDRPLVAQFCGNEPYWVLKAAKWIENSCDAVDINLGCPQRIAKKGRYGAFLMDEPERVYRIVKTLHENLRVPVFCKIRVFDEYEKTLEFAKMLESAGCQLLTIHGRTRMMKGQMVGLANWDWIRRLKNELSIPVFANGNVIEYEDVVKCMEVTKADGVMSAEGLLDNPAIFSGSKFDPFQLSYEYLEECERHPTIFVWKKNHISRILKSLLEKYPTFIDKLFCQRNVEGIKQYLKNFQEAIENNAEGLDTRLKKKERTPGDIFENFEFEFFGGDE